MKFHVTERKGRLYFFVEDAKVLVFFASHHKKCALKMNISGHPVSTLTSERSEILLFFAGTPWEKKMQWRGYFCNHP